MGVGTFWSWLFWYLLWSGLWNPEPSLYTFKKETTVQSTEGDSTWKKLNLGAVTCPYSHWGDLSPISYQVMDIMSHRQLLNTPIALQSVSGAYPSTIVMRKVIIVQAFIILQLSLPSLPWVCWNAVIVQLEAVFIFEDNLLEMNKYLRETIPFKGLFPYSKAFCVIKVSQKLFCEINQTHSF